MLSEKQIGQLIKTIQIAQGLTQQELADKAGISRRSVSLAEKGSFGREVEYKIKTALGLPLDDPQIEIIFLIFAGEVDLGDGRVRAVFCF